MAKKKSAAKSGSAVKKSAAVVKKPAPSTAGARASAVRSAVSGTGKASGTQSSGAPSSGAQASGQRIFGFTFDVGPSDDGDRIVEVPYPRGVDGDVLAIILQPARDAGGIPDDWTEQHAVQVLRYSREPGGTATVRIHRIDSGWVGQGWAGNLVLHVLVAIE